MAARRKKSGASGFPLRIGIVRHYYAHMNAAVVDLQEGELRVGDVVHFHGRSTDFYERIEKLEIDGQAIDVARAGDVAGIQISRSVRENDDLYLLSL